MKLNLKQVIVAVALTLTLPLTGHGQGFERISLGAKGVYWSVPDLDTFSLGIEGPGLSEIHEIGESELFGVRPFLRLGLTRRLAVELSHEFAFGDDVDLTVSSGSGIWRPFGESGLEFHASICYGQLDWGGPGDFESAWGWEVGGGYSLRLFRSVSLVAGVAYRDLSFAYNVVDLLDQIAETAVSLSLPQESADSAGVVAGIGVFITF